MNYTIPINYVEQAVCTALRLVKQWDKNEVERFNFDIVSYIKERRTIGLSLPRQCGKTRYIYSLFYRNKSVLIRLPGSREVFRPELEPYAPKDICSFINYVRGRNLGKIDYLLIDEPDMQRESVDDWIRAIHIAGLMGENFIVIKIGTDCK